MNDISVTGIVVSLCFFFLRYAIPTMKPWIAWFGFVAGVLVLMIGDISTMRLDKLNVASFSPATYAAVSALLLLASLASGWRAYIAHQDGWPLSWTWGSFMMTSFDPSKASPRIEQFNGMVENISNSPVHIEEMQLVAGQSSKSFEVFVNDRFGKYLPARQFENIPAHSDRIDFRALFKSETEFLSEAEYWSQIDTLEFFARYAGREYRRKFSRKEIKAEIDKVRPKPDLPYPAVKKAE